jgi:hypothetical protein
MQNSAVMLIMTLLASHIAPTSEPYQKSKPRCHIAKETDDFFGA